MVEDLILSSLLHNEGYGRKVIPFLRVRYFHDKSDRVIFETIASYVEQYNRFPNKVAIETEIENQAHFTNDEFVILKLRLAGLEDTPADVRVG